MALDLDRGVTKRRHPSGFIIAMYKDEPGVFYDVNEERVGQEAARAAGFDVDELSKERMKREKMAEARQRIEEQFSSTEADIERILNAQASSYEIKHLGSGLYGVFDQDGNRLTNGSMTKDECQRLLEELNLTNRGGNTPAPPEAPARAYEAQHKGGGRWVVVDGDGSVISEELMDKQTAQAEADRLNEEAGSGHPAEE